MWCSLVHCTIILLLFQGGAFRAFASKRHGAERIKLFKSSRNENKFSRSEEGGDVNDVHGLPQLVSRVRRQNMAGGDPEAYSFTLYNDDHQYARVSYLGEGSKVIFLLTYDISSSSVVTSSQLYRSTDNGRNFWNQNNKLRSGYRLHYVIYRFPNSRTVMFADSKRSTIYFTTDEGNTFRSYSIPVNPRTLKIHPTRPGWILGHDSNQGVLMYSKNSGASWSIVAQNVHSRYYSNYSKYDFTWGEPGVDWDINNPCQSDITTVFYGVYRFGAAFGNNRIIYIAKNFGSGYTSEVLDYTFGYCGGFILDGNFIFAAKYINGSEVELHVSYMRNPFRLTRIPTTFSHYFYFVTSHRSSQALVIIEHETHYNLYLSDETGIYFTLSLMDIVADDEKLTVDLQIINSISGTMMANQFVRAGRLLHNQTLITFDNGAQWHNIEDSSCIPLTCFLHFHMYSSIKYFRIAVYSRSSAPGIIVAYGNRGSYLMDSGNVYISRNGGLTWQRTLDYTWHVEIIDHGGLLVAAKDNHQYTSRTIKYSCDEGMTWSDFHFITSYIVVWGIVTEPGETTTQVLLFGTRTQYSRSDWIVTHVNFTSIFARTCESSDYEDWNVSDGRIGDQQCLLGEARIIERRRPSVCCWNSRQYERVISTTPCQCTAADFECEWGYYRSNSGTCTLNNQYGPQLDCLTGYRKIPGDVCLGGVSTQYLPPSDCVMNEDYYPPRSKVCVSNVTVTTLNHLIVGQPLMLECDMSTPRGIDNTVDIVWTRDGIVVERIDDVNSNSSSPEWIFYTNNIYTIPLLGTSDDDVVYECEVIIYASPLVRIRASTILNVTVPIPAVTVSPSARIKEAMVGSPLDIQCIVSTVSGVELSSVRISWMKPGGRSIRNSSRVTISPTTFNGNNYTSSLQFAYLIGDERITCRVAILDTVKSQTFEIETFTTGNTGITNDEDDNSSVCVIVIPVVIAVITIATIIMIILILAIILFIRKRKKSTSSVAAPTVASSAAMPTVGSTMPVPHMYEDPSVHFTMQNQVNAEQYIFMNYQSLQEAYEGKGEAYEEAYEL